MAKTEKELQELKKKVEEIRKELKEFSEEELEKVAGGADKPDSSAKYTEETSSNLLIPAK